MIYRRAGDVASIADRGYQHYTGTRLGLANSLSTIVWAGILRGMGIRRSAKSKIMPWLLVVVAYAPIVFILASQALSGRLGGKLVSASDLFAGYYSGIALVLIVFVSVVAPDLLCPDRREQVLSLYFVAPITRTHYVAAKLAALVILLLLLTIAPGLILFAGTALLGTDAAGYISSNAGDVWRLVVGGTILSLYYGSLGMAIASFTDRRVYASGGIIGFLLIGSVASGIVSQNMHFSGHGQFALLDFISLPIESMGWLFNQRLTAHLDGWSYLLATAAVTLLSLAVLEWQYLRLRD